MNKQQTQPLRAAWKEHVHVKNLDDWDPSYGE